MPEPRTAEEAAPRQQTRFRWSVLLLIALLIPACIFGAWEILEQQVLIHRVDLPTLHILHIVRGIATALLLAGVVAWYLLREKFPVFPDRESTAGLLRLIDRDERLRQHLLWFIQMRWLAGGLVLALILIAVPVARILPMVTLAPLLSWWGLLVVANALFMLWFRRDSRLERQIVVQAAIDLVILTGLLNASGGIENPLYLAYLFHVIIPGILLPKKKAFALAALAAVLFCVLAFGEYSGVLPHYTNELFPHGDRAGGHQHEGHVEHASYDPLFVAGRGFPFLLVLVLTSYFTTVVADRLRRSEKDLERAARAAMLEQERLERVVDTAGVGMMLLSPDVTIHWYSGRAADWLSLDDRALEKRCPLDGAPGGCPTCIVSRTAAAGRPFESERRVVSEGGAVRHFRHGTSPVRDENGQVIQVVELVEEITERKALEAEALHTGKLSVLGRMAAGIAHEIGNPLSSLTTRLHLMERSREPEFFEESLKVLRGQISRIGHIVRSVSQFARRGDEDWANWDLNAVVEEAIGIVRLDRRSNRIEFRRELATPAPVVRGVRDQISQVVLNLLLNAVEAMPGGGVITVETVCRDGIISLAVTDTGTGMDEAVRKRLFEPFFTTKIEGTGLGLSISYSFVHAHGGRIEVRSAPGEGSRFTVILPAAGTDAGRGPTGTGAAA